MSDIDIPIKPANEARDVVLKSILNDIVARIEIAIAQNSFSIYYEIENNDYAIEKIDEILSAKGYQIRICDNQPRVGIDISW